MNRLFFFIQPLEEAVDEIADEYNPVKHQIDVAKNEVDEAIAERKKVEDEYAVALPLKVKVANHLDQKLADNEQRKIKKKKRPK